MKPTHYHTFWGFSAVTLYEHRGIVWTSDGYKADSIDLKPLSDLVGVAVSRAGWNGRIVEFLTDKRELVDGEYLPAAKRYGLKRKLEFKNSQVGVFWESNSNLRDCPLLPYWNNFHSLKLL